MSRPQSTYTGRVSSSSRLSARSSTSAVKNPRTPVNPSSKLQKIVEAEESAMVVYAIREDLLRRVTDECYSRYLERQTVKFLVDCACTALKQMIELDFFVHDFGQPFYENHPAWSADLPPEPSPADTWASGNVPVVTELEEESPSKEEVAVKGSTSLDIIEGDVPGETESETEAARFDDEFPQERRVSFDESRHSIMLQVPHVSEIFEGEAEAEEVAAVLEQPSIFSNISKCDEAHAVKNVYSELVKGRSGSRMQRLSQVVATDKKILKLAEVSDNVPKLPPIRADTMLRRASLVPVEKPKSKK